MGLWPTHGDERAQLRFSDSKRVTRGFRGSALCTAQVWIRGVGARFGNETSQNLGRGLGRSSNNTPPLKVRVRRKPNVVGPGY
jgi:hypothetical protein